MNPDIICLAVYVVVGILILCIGAWNSDFDTEDPDALVGLILFVIVWPLLLFIVILLSPIWIPGVIAVGISRLSKKVRIERQNRKEPLQKCLALLEEMDTECKKELERFLAK